MTTGKSAHRSRLVALTAGSFALAYLCFFLVPDLLGPWNLRAVDQLYLLRERIGRRPGAFDNTVVHVDLNNASIASLGRRYLDRSLYARLIGNLSAMDAGMQLFDFVFAAPVNTVEDAALKEATRKAANVYFGAAFELGAVDQYRDYGTRPAQEVTALEKWQWPVTVEGDVSGLPRGIRPLPTFAALADASQGLGFLNLQPDSDGVFRRAPLLVRYENAFFPSLSLMAACRYLKVPPGQVLLKPGRWVVLERARYPGQTEPVDIRIPIDRQGRMIVDFVGPWGKTKHYNFTDVLVSGADRDTLALWRQTLAEKIVLVADVTTGSSDIGPIPVDTHYPLSGVHANAVRTILSRTFLRELSGTPMLLIESGLMMFVLLLALRRSFLWLLSGVSLLSMGYVALSAGLFLKAGLILHLVRPLLMMLAAAVSLSACQYLQEAKEKVFLRKTFEAYFPPSVVLKVMRSPEKMAAGGTKKELTILFSDIKGFTSYSEDMPPDRVQQVLNAYFEVMTDIVFDHGGTLDKFMGDGLMVFFGDPQPDAQHALHGVQAAIAMQRAMARLNRQWRQGAAPGFEIRIGIHTGLVLVGNMGSSRRLSYTVLGAAVNLAQRLESNAPVGGILISRDTYHRVSGQISATPRGAMAFKGFSRKMEVYEVDMHSAASSASGTDLLPESCMKK